MATAPKHKDTVYEPVPRTEQYDTLEKWSIEVHTWAVSKGWWDEGAKKSFVECMMLVVTEVAEAVEHFRDGRPYDQVFFYLDDEGELKPDGIPVEIADVFIRLFDTVEAFGIPLESAIRLKQSYNLRRSHRHGGKRI